MHDAAEMACICSIQVAAVLAKSSSSKWFRHPPWFKYPTPPYSRPTTYSAPLAVTAPN